MPEAGERSLARLRERAAEGLGEGIAIALIILFGAFLRLHALDRQSIWDDEMSTIQTISMPVSQWVERFETYETHPPAYFAQLSLWRAVGAKSLVGLRANSAVWGTLGLFLMALLGRRYLGRLGGLAALGFLTVSPLHLAYSQELRPYAMSITLALLALLLLERARRSAAPWLWIAVGGVWALQLQTHYWGAFVVAAQALYAFRAAGPGHRTRIAAALGGAALLFAPWLPVLWKQVVSVELLGFWTPPFSFANLFKPFTAFSGLYFHMASWTFYLPTRTGFLLLVMLFFLFLFARGVRRGPAVAIYWLSAIIVPWTLSYWQPSVFLWYRYPTHMLPAFILILIAGVFSFASIPLRAVFLALCLACQLWGDWFYLTRWQKANPRAVVTHVHRLRAPNTIVVRPAHFGYLFQFYDQGTMSVVDEEALDNPAQRAALKGRSIVLIRFDAANPIADALMAEFKVVSTKRFPGLVPMGITVHQLQ